MGHIRKTAFIILFFLPFSAFGDEIHLRADTWCPYNCEPNSGYEGYLIDLAREIFDSEGHDVTYTLMPWIRSLHMAERFENSAAPGAYKRERHNLVYPDVPAGFSVNSFVTLKSSNWKYTGVQSLKNVRIAAINSYLFGEPVDSYFNKNRDKINWLYGSDPLRSALRMLKSGKVQVIIDDHNVLHEVALQMGMLDDIRFAGDVLPGEGVYIGFSAKGEKGRLYAKQFSDGIVQLRKSGRLQEILDKYNLKDWASN